MDALDGISFLSDQVAKLGEDNERLRREGATKAEAHADAVKSLRLEVHSLRSDLARLRGPPRLAEFPPLPPMAVAETKLPTPRTPISSQNPVLPVSATTSPMPVASASPPLLGMSPPTQQRRARHTAPRPLAVGASDGTGLVAIDRPRPPRAIFVTKLRPCTTSAQVAAHLSSVGAVPTLCKRLKTKHDSYASFYIAVDNVCFDRLRDPALWPRHCLFKPFRGELCEQMIHAEEHRCDER